MSAFERKADMEHLAPRLGVSKVCLRAESRPRGAARLMSARSQQQTFPTKENLAARRAIWLILVQFYQPLACLYASRYPTNSGV